MSDPAAGNHFHERNLVAHLARFSGQLRSRGIDRSERDETAGERLAGRAVEALPGRDGIADRKRRITL